MRTKEEIEAVLKEATVRWNAALGIRLEGWLAGSVKDLCVAMLSGLREEPPRTQALDDIDALLTQAVTVMRAHTPTPAEKPAPKRSCRYGELL